MQASELMENESAEAKLALLNGFLHAIQTWANNRSTEVEHKYFFDRQPRKHDSFPVDIFQFLSRFADTAWPSRAFGSLSKEEFHLKPIKNWKNELPAIVSDWVATPDPQWQYPKHSHPPHGQFMAEALRDLLQAYFGGVQANAYTLEGTFTDALYISWGGVSFKDVFFEVGEFWYVLHFECCD